MERIDSLGGFFHPDAVKPDKKKVERKGIRKTAFSDVVDRATEEYETDGPEGVMSGSTDGGLEKLLDEIHTLGEKLKDVPTLERVVQYKNAVRGFIRFVVQNCLKVEEHESRANILNRKRFTLIQVIDQKLERLAAGVISNQKDQILLLSRVHEIQGLLIDLLH